MHKVLPCVMAWAVLTIVATSVASDGVLVTLLAAPMLFFLALSMRSGRQGERDRLRR